jgi:predicted O-methyltransferase YrrM
MNQEQWDNIEHYTSGLLATSDAHLKAALEASVKGGLPSIQVSPVEGKLLAILAQTVGAKRILEIGTLGGYSTIWLARTLPSGGRLISLEADPKHAEVARGNIARAGLADRVEIRQGLAIESLPKIAAERIGPFDLTFIDADKQSTWEYFDWAVRLSRSGSLIVVDNVIRHGALIDESSSDQNVIGMRRFCENLARDKRVSGTVIQTVGSKGYDGFAMAVVAGG